MSKDVVVLTDQNWQTEVSQAKGVVLVDFWAEWCHPCRLIGPAVEAVASSYKGRVRVGKLNVDENPAVAQAYGIRSIPTLMVFRDGEAVDQQLGAVPPQYITAMLDAQLDSAKAEARIA